MLLAPPSADAIASVIELAVAPVFLLVAIGGFLNVCAGRLARIVDRARAMEPVILAARGAEHDQLVEEARLLDRRIRVVNSAITMAVLAAVFICLLVVLLFVTGLFQVDLASVIALLFIAAIIAVGSSFTIFLVETRLATRMVRVPSRLLFHEAED
ncbi:DUF2721 domain-containing protein [Sphingomicrobium lutaoense]|uniref:DUF2721 domain-containing protein n=1 Tax=Sphingomicrobium lutaoense TaxID=515949 RepID=A0A839YX74_9SPHN|nr:DUF2721 domain-containing protein [Sphingomicrobium lutaoense]MBB3763080.1 hypothetical protein [Sphingomicrobium lutaoense]